jgi:hypothetical protein
VIGNESRAAAGGFEGCFVGTGGRCFTEIGELGIGVTGGGVGDGKVAGAIGE